eukprot:COSAG05_NODE_2156_length_3459_cov_6.286310_4_plen_266_part_00
MEVRGLPSKAAAANGAYQLQPGATRHGRRVYNQTGAEGHELSFDGGAWTVAMREDKSRCWAYAEKDMADPDRIPLDEWHIFDGAEWVAAPSGFRVSAASVRAQSPTRSRPAAAATTAVEPDHDRLPPGWETAVSRSKGAVYYIHVETGETQWEFPTAPAAADIKSEGQAESKSTEGDAKQADPPGSGVALLAPGPEPQEQQLFDPVLRSGFSGSALDEVKALLQAERQQREQIEAELEAELRRHLEIEQEIVKLAWRGGESLPER